MSAPRVEALGLQQGGRGANQQRLAKRLAFPNPQDVHILLVDDDRLSCTIVASLLRKCGYTVSVASSGVEAVSKLGQAPAGTYDLILTDLVMPEVDGLDLLHYVRENTSLSAIPVVMMSASTSEDNIMTCIKDGAEDYLFKPLSRREVEFIWQHVWRRKHSCRAVPALAAQMRAPAGSDGALLDLPSAQALATTLVPASNIAGAEGPLGGALGAVRPEQLLRSCTPPVRSCTPPVRCSSGSFSRHPGLDALLSPNNSSDNPPAPTQEVAGIKVPETGDRVSSDSQTDKLIEANGATSPTTSGHVGPLAGPQGPLVGPVGYPTLADWMAARKELDVNCTFNVFCRVVSLLKAHHVQDRCFGRLRPSMLRITPVGSLVLTNQHAFPPGLPAPPGAPAGPPAPQLLDLIQPKLSLASLAHVPSVGEGANGVPVVPGGPPGPPLGANMGPSRAAAVGLGAASVHTRSLCEQAWYASPEEEHGQEATPLSDMFSLGMFYVDLFYTVGLSFAERSQLLLKAKEGRCPLELLERREEADYVLSALRAEPTERPSVADVLYSDTLPKLLDSLSLDTERPEPAQWGMQSDDKALLDFLLIARQRATLASMAMQRELARLDLDMQRSQALMEQRPPSKRARSRALGAPKGAQGPAGMEIDSTGNIGAADNLPLPKRRKVEGPAGAPRGAPGAQDDGSHRSSQYSIPLAVVHGTAAWEMGEAEHEAESSGEDGSDSEGDVMQRLLQEPDVLPRMENVYMEHRRRCVANEVSGKEFLEEFCSSLTHYTRYNKLVGVSTVKYGDTQRSMHDMVCSVAFDRDDEFLATAGISRRLKVFDFRSAIGSSATVHYPVLEFNARSKLSCVAWNPYVKSSFAASDYDGSIQLWDAATKAEVMQFEEHARRVWSIDFSPSDPMRLVSGSDDHTVKLWALNCDSSAVTLDVKANVCSVQFHPQDANIVAAGAANYRVYMFDVRNPRTPLGVFGGHGRSVSYVRFLDSEHLVSAATDSKLRLWSVKNQLTGQIRATQQQPSMVYEGHKNLRNFSGLSINRQGYIACGSEDNSVVVYSHKMPMPVAKYSFADEVPLGGPVGGRDASFPHFVSATAWTGNGKHLVVANSTGILKVLELQ